MTKPAKRPAKSAPKRSVKHFRAPEAPVGLAPPMHLHDDSRAAWLELAADPLVMRYATPSDRWALEILADLIGDRRKLRRHIGDQGGDLSYETITESGAAMRRSAPELQAIATINRQATDLLGRFGLTVADRARVMSDLDKPARTDLGEFLADPAPLELVR